MGNLRHGFRGRCWISTGLRLDFEVLRGDDTDSILHAFYRNVKDRQGELNPWPTS